MSVGQGVMGGLKMEQLLADTATYGELYGDVRIWAA